MTGLESVRDHFERKLKTTSESASFLSDMSAGAALPRELHGVAIAQFEREEPLPLSPNAPEIIGKLLHHSGLLLANKEFSLAMNLYRNVLLRHPNQPEALQGMGRCLRERNKLSEAIKYFQALIKFRRDPVSLHDYAETLYLVGRDPEAFVAYHEVLQSIVSDETDASGILFEIYKNLGNIHVRSGDFEAAEESYNKAYTLKADSDALLVNYGTLEVQRDNAEAAVQRFRGAVEINPENDRAWVGLGLLHRQMGDFELAMANLERALDINARNKTALNLVVEWGVTDGIFATAVRRLSEYLCLCSEDFEISFSLAKILVHLNRLDEAELELERALLLEPTSQDAASLMQALASEKAKRRVAA